MVGFISLEKHPKPQTLNPKKSFENLLSEVPDELRQYTKSLSHDADVPEEDGLVWGLGR